MYMLQQINTMFFYHRSDCTKIISIIINNKHRHCRLVHRQAILGYVLQSGSYFHVLSTQTACRWSLSQPTYILFLVFLYIFFIGKCREISAKD